MGVEFVKGKIGKIEEQENGDLLLRYEDIQNEKIRETTHDLVVLSVGLLANTEYREMFTGEKPEQDRFSFVKLQDELTSPARTSMEGIFVAGTASGPMDIPDSILSAGAASAEAAGYLKSLNHEK